LPGEVVGFALFDRSGLVAGVAGLMPALPSSVAPSGIPTRPIDEGEGRGDEIGRLSAQESEVLPASPPPSNKAAEGPAPSEPAQVVIPAFREGSTGLMPGVAISVEPSGMPAGAPDPAGSGDVAPMPTAGGIFWVMDCAIAGPGDRNMTPAVNDAQRTVDAIPRGLSCGSLRCFGTSCFRIFGAPGQIALMDNMELRVGRYSRNARAAVWMHDEGHSVHSVRQRHVTDAAPLSR
jgi:hypothetical protein